MSAENFAPVMAAKVEHAGKRTADKIQPLHQTIRHIAQQKIVIADMHRRARSNLLDMLAWIRELISMIHLAQLARAPASRTQELLAQIAAAAESVAVAVEDRSDSPRKS